MPDLEAIGDAATGAVLAGSVEPRTGEAGDDGHTHERNCLNCGCALTGDYCHCCGQRAHVHRTLGAFWHDLAHSVVHFEGKIWRTLPMLAVHPGELTRRYVHGERARFVSPMALFLFTVFLMFALFSLLGGAVDTGEFRNSAADIRAALEEEQRDLKDAREERAEAVRERNAQAVAAADKEIAQTLEGIAALQGFVAVSANGRSDFVGGKTGWARVDAGLKKLNDNPALALYKIQNNAYKFSWALIPISLPLVWLLFLHRRRYRQEYGAYDHLIFITYSISFMSLALVTFVVLNATPMPNALLTLAFVVVPPLHIYRQLRGAYLLSRWSAAWRAFVLLVFANVAIALFIGLLLVLGVLG
jgi:hypothetical protein